MTPISIFDEIKKIAEQVFGEIEVSYEGDGA